MRTLGLVVLLCSACTRYNPAFEQTATSEGDEAPETLGTTLATTEPVIEWQEAGTVLKISLKAFDADEFFGGVDLFPWRVDIPHEELNFASGSHDIAAGEVQKLDEVPYPVKMEPNLVVEFYSS